jgi:hypothetical protein
VKLDLAIEQVISAEEELADQLEKVGERHRADHDVFHMTETLAKMSRARIAKLGGRSSGDSRRGGVLTAVREKASEVAGSRPESGLLLLGDLRRLHLLAAAASINWTILGQAAQAAKDSELLAIVSECHAEELRALRWTTTHVKVVAPQALAS